jgi:hypothetical protein
MLMDVEKSRRRDGDISNGRVGQSDLGLRHVNEKVL